MRLSAMIGNLYIPFFVLPTERLRARGADFVLALDLKGREAECGVSTRHAGRQSGVCPEEREGGSRCSVWRVLATCRAKLRTTVSRARSESTGTRPVPTQARSRERRVTHVQTTAPHYVRGQTFLSPGIFSSRNHQRHKPYDSIEINVIRLR